MTLIPEVLFSLLTVLGMARSYKRNYDGNSRSTATVAGIAIGNRRRCGPRGHCGHSFSAILHVGRLVVRAKHGTINVVEIGGGQHIAAAARIESVRHTPGLTVGQTSLGAADFGRDSVFGTEFDYSKGPAMKLAFGTNLAFFFALTNAFAQPQKLDPARVWKGSVADESLEKAVPTVVVTQKKLDALWELWKQPGKAPQIDFAKEIAVFTTSRGSVLNLIVERKEKDLKVLGFGTRDFRDGFRFVVGAVSRDGIETVNGMALPKE
jgi:hypothetical protein